jgi:FkbM family methyltransferase
VSALINSQGLYDYNNMRLLQWLLREGGTFFDIGANIGSYTLLASEQRKTQVFAFEPHPHTFALLAENIRINLRQNVRLHQAALSHCEDIAYLTNSAGSSTNYLACDRGLDSLQVPVKRVDSVCQQQGAIPEIVKLDVEGHEYEVLEGFGSYLDHVQVLFIEINGLSDERGAGQRFIHAKLIDAGFTGPWRCDFDRSTLSWQRGVSREDSLYLSRGGCRRLISDGWTVPESV